MKYVSILVLHDSVMASIVDARTMFAGVNEFLETEGKSPRFRLQFVGLAKQVKLYNGGFCT